MNTVFIRAALYVRLSKEDTRGRMLGIESTQVQTADGTAAIEAQGWTLKKVYVDDGFTGTTLERPGLNQLRDAARRRELDVVVVRDQDRLGRVEPVDMMALFAELRAHSVRVWSYKTKTFIQLQGLESIVTFIGAITAQQEAAKASSRIKDALAARAREGRATKFAPFGYAIETREGTGKRWVIDPQQREVVLHIARLFVQTRTLNGTATRLNEEGVRPPRAEIWRTSMLRQLLS